VKLWVVAPCEQCGALMFIGHEPSIEVCNQFVKHKLNVFNTFRSIVPSKVDSGSIPNMKCAEVFTADRTIDYRSSSYGKYIDSNQ